jgi:RNA polymerase sigma-70 factor (ECF subfamily)
MVMVEARPLDDTRLIRAAQGGDMQAYEELVRRYQDLAFRCAFLVVGNAEDANDVTQDAFVRAFAALPRFRADAAIRPWLLAIVSNQARNHRRSRRRREGLALRAGEEAPRQDVPSPEESVLGRERRAELLAAIEGLREEDRQVITLRWFAELTEAEMAALLQRPSGTIKSRLSRAMRRLRAALAADEEARTGD